MFWLCFCCCCRRRYRPLFWVIVTCISFPRLLVIVIVTPASRSPFLAYLCAVCPQTLSSVLVALHGRAAPKEPRCYLLLVWCKVTRHRRCTVMRAREDVGLCLLPFLPPNYFHHTDSRSRSLPLGNFQRKMRRSSLSQRFCSYPSD